MRSYLYAISIGFMYLVAPLSACDSSDEIAEDQILVATDEGIIPHGGELVLAVDADVWNLRIVSAGRTPVTVTGIGWARGPSGLPERNPYVMLYPGTLPFTLETQQSETAFAVGLTTEFRFIQDLSPSTLIITSERTDINGVVTVTEFPIVVRIERLAGPKIEPSAMTFGSAPQGRQSIPLSISQQVQGGWFYVTGCEFETPTTELSLMTIDTFPVRVESLELMLFVDFTPTSGDPSTNAVLCYTDASDTPLKIPITVTAPFMELQFKASDPAEFDFRGVTTKTSRTVTFTNTGTLPVEFQAPTFGHPTTRSAFPTDFRLGSSLYEGSGYRVGDWPQTLEPAAALTIEMTHTPVRGTRDGELTMEYGLPDQEPTFRTFPLMAATP